MKTQSAKNQSGRGSKIDDSYPANNPETGDDDFLSGDNAKKTYPNNQNNPNPEYNSSFSPGMNPNIAGNESEYDTAANDDDFYGEDSIPDNTEGFVNRKDTEEIDRHIDWRNRNSDNGRLSEE